MYCKKCGKYIESDATICTECQDAEAMFSAPAYPQYSSEVYTQPISQPMQQPTTQGRVMDGFKPALISTILAYVASNILAGLLELVMMLFVPAEELSEFFSFSFFSFEAGGAAAIALIVLLSLAAIGMSIPSIVLGAKSISFFKERKQAGYKKPIPALILGIYGMSVAIINVCLAMLYFLLLMIGTMM